MKVMAHRGFSSQAPENTLAAFKKAIDYGCQWIELDVQLSADNVPIVFHDQDLSRCTSGQGNVSDYTLQQLRQFSAGNGFSGEFSNETIPTLQEVLLIAKTHNTSLNIELKPYPADDEQLLCQQITQVIHAVKMPSELILFSSFQINALQHMKEMLPDIRRGILWQNIPENAFTLLQELDAYSVHCDYRYLTEQQAREIKRKGYQLYCYTPNNPMDVQHYWLWGVDMMITDTPDRYAC